MVVEPTDDPSYRYELWKLDTNTPVHIRITARAIELHDPVLIERGSFDGYPVGYRDSGVDGGAAAGVRLLAPGSTWRPWLEVGATRWLGKRTVLETVSGQERDIPDWSASAALGVSLFDR